MEGVEVDHTSRLCWWREHSLGHTPTIMKSLYGHVVRGPVARRNTNSFLTKLRFFFCITLSFPCHDVSIQPLMGGIGVAWSLSGVMSPLSAHFPMLHPFLMFVHTQQNFSFTSKWLPFKMVLRLCGIYNIISYSVPGDVHHSCWEQKPSNWPKPILMYR